MTITLFEVGGCVRDALLGKPSKDIDFAVEAPSFDALRTWLVDNGFAIFTEAGEFLTIRAHFPKTHPQHGKTTADFVLCRKERGSLNGRHPEHVEPGTIFDDLARRDFTVNAMARSLDTGDLFDPHGGVEDLRRNVLRFVGNPADRLAEDGLRALRAVRFAVTRGFRLDEGTEAAITAMPKALTAVSTERIRDELDRCFRTDTLATLRLLDRLDLTESLFSRPNLRLSATLRG